jgi:heptosyltransferase-2
VVVTNDSGLLHLSEAVGTPVVALFGPTVREFGYFPRLGASAALEVPLECRPCSRNGKRPCHRGDLACLERIEVGAVLERVARREGNR